MNFLKQVEERLSEADVKQLKNIYEPTVVAVPDENPGWGILHALKDGSIRMYGGYKNRSTAKMENCYLQSLDAGLSWKRYFAPKESAFGYEYVPQRATFSYHPKGDVFLRLGAENGGTYAYIAPTLDSKCAKIFVCDTPYVEYRRPFITKDGRTFVLVHENRFDLHESALFSCLFISDDVGKTWKFIKLPAVPFYQKQSENTGIRWQQNCREGTIEELSDGTLLLIVRTAIDFHWYATSTDGGDTWSEFKESTFHGTATMPLLKKLSDGRLLFFWCNTKPLPELKDADGVWEDVFTNRDVNHVAISHDDGKSWLGFREVGLNEIRNDVDFRSQGGDLEIMHDKSVHQFEAIELPFNKVLLIYGQHKSCRKAVIFDLDWLYDSTREDDFKSGLVNLTTHTYIKSILGGYQIGGSGHCAYNRTNITYLTPDPEQSTLNEVLCIKNVDDERLINNVGGAVWNFSASKKGRVTITAHLNGGIRVSLLDFWMNTCDTTVSKSSLFSMKLEKYDSAKFYVDYTFSFDCEKGDVVVYADEKLVFSGKLMAKLDNGISYLHLQALSSKEAFIKKLNFKAE